MIDHISIAVRDLDASAAFYVRALAPSNSLASSNDRT